MLCVCVFFSSLLTECRLTKIVSPNGKVYGENCAITAKHVVDSCCANGLEVKDKARGIASKCERSSACLTNVQKYKKIGSCRRGLHVASSVGGKSKTATVWGATLTRRKLITWWLY